MRIECCQPVVCEFEITNICPLDCMHCVQHKGNKSNSLTTNKIKSVLCELRDIGTQEVCISGGEPLMHPNFREIVHHSIKLGLATSLYTSAVIVSQVLASQLYDIGIKKVFVTLLGDNPAVHDQISRKAGSFRKTVQGIKNLVVHNFYVIVHVPILKPNYKNISGTVDLCEDLGVDAFHLIRYFPHNIKQNKNAKKLLVNSNDLRYAVEIAISKAKEKSRKIEFIPGSAIPFALVDHSEINLELCNAATSRCYVTHSGYVVPCPGFREPELLRADNNINNRALRDIWKSSFVMHLARKHSIDNLYGKCHFCPNSRKCIGGCPAQSYIYFKDVLQPDPLCWY